MANDSLSRRTFIAATGAVVAGAMAGCGSAGGLPVVAPTSDGSGVGEIVTAPGVSEGLQEAAREDGTLWRLTRADFEGWLGESFTVRSEAASDDPLLPVDPIELDLVDVEDRSAGMTQEQRDLGLREPFSVRFHSDPRVAKKEGRYLLTHPGLGEVAVFLSDAGSTEDMQEPYVGPEAKIYELHFN